MRQGIARTSGTPLSMSHSNPEPFDSPFTTIFLYLPPRYRTYKNSRRFQILCAATTTPHSSFLTPHYFPVPRPSYAKSGKQPIHRFPLFSQELFFFQPTVEFHFSSTACEAISVSGTTATTASTDGCSINVTAC